MKKVIMTLAILALFVGAANACEPYTALLLTEGDDPLVQACDVQGLGNFDPIEWRLWIYNDTVKGLGGFEMGMDFGGFTTYLAGELNPAAIYVAGTVTTSAFAGSFTSCQRDQYVWIAKFSKPYTGTPHMMTTIPNSDSGAYQVTSCEENYPKYPVIKGNEFGVMLPCEVDTDTESWGAVKSMYR